MKPEPLKGKEIEYQGAILFRKDTIQKAVEWLKQQLLEGNLRLPYDTVRELIDKAFEDVVKESQKGD
jgi:hypothetical protein